MMNNNLTIINFLIENGSEIDCKNQYDQTPLLYSANFGYFEVFKLLIEKDANINQRNKSNWTSLHYAASNGYLDLVKFIYSNNKFEFPDDLSFLHFSASKGLVDIILFFIEKGVNINILDNNLNFYYY